ncbi:extracellular catalytic domain type 1 short-chain-length polyhydroxyalkanoate depolymerase [Halomarina oriensis]|uniref:extracellular catalytic domain type 1 short-chain-length polyhydroxyalkanoate depolymerase n=1 Tax=Halomarina oriensis TaxID=671145 RepID=UPI0034A16942
MLRTLGAAAATSAVASTATAAAGSFTDQRYDGRRYKRYVPSGYDGSTSTALVVMLHGCTQTPGGFASETRMNELAEQEGFLVVYPDQTSSANANECWNWFEPAHQQRGSGEPALVAGMTREVVDGFEVDPERVYLAGFSAGGGMAPIMGVTYPDLYSGIGVHSGLEYDAANSLTEATTAMNSGGPDPQQKGTLAYRDMGSRARVVPTVVFHGTSDYTVVTRNGHQAAEQATQTIDLAADDTDDDGTDYTAETTRTEQSAGHSYTVSEYADESGTVVVAKYIVDGMGHAWAGGASGGAYTDPDAPDASAVMWEFFESSDGGDGGGDGGGGDGDDGTNDAPAASVTANPTTAAVDESVTFDATGSTDSDGTVASYDWSFGDGATASGATASHAYGSAGSYTATVTVTDDAGATDSASVTVTVESTAGYCGTATNYAHGTAGRASQSMTGAYYAEGSDDYMGFPAYSSTLKETAPGYFEVVQNC